MSRPGKLTGLFVFLAVSSGGTPPAPPPAVSASRGIAIVQDDGSLSGHENLFNLDHSTIRFTPQPAGGYLVEKIPLVWDDSFGTSMAYDGAAVIGSHEVPFTALAFPLGGTTWHSVVVN